MKAVDDLHLNGIKVYATVMKASKAIADVDLTEPCAFVMGGRSMAFILRFEDMR